MPTLDGRMLRDKVSLLSAIGQALHFPEYYGANWDALEECLSDLSWHEGPVQLLIIHVESIPAELVETLEDLFAEVAAQWSGKEFALYLAESGTT